MIRLYQILLFVTMSLSCMPVWAQDGDTVVVDTVPRFIYSVGAGAGVNGLMNNTIRVLRDLV